MKRFIIAFLAAYFSIFLIGVLFSLPGGEFSIYSIAVAVLYASAIVIPICFLVVLNMGHHHGGGYGLNSQMRNDGKFMKLRKFRNPIESVLWAIICVSLLHAATAYWLVNYLR